LPLEFPNRRIDPYFRPGVRKAGKAITEGTASIGAKISTCIGILDYAPTTALRALRELPPTPHRMGPTSPPRPRN
jgi:hypothetical protein